jgi:FtsP/CotA-like multicopper oxidase with cupredoxin domain
MGAWIRLSRRSFVRGGLATAVTVAGGGFLLPAPASATTRTVRRVAAAGRVGVGAGRSYSTWLYDGVFPGPEIRLAEGERLRVELVNQLPEASTIHWHGVPVPNAMDGVPGVTQAPVAPGGTFVYEFEAQPAGSYLYHSHFGLQLDRALAGPLIIEEASPHVAYDRDYTLLFDDFLSGAPGAGGMGGGMGMGGMGMGGHMPRYAGMLVNGRLPQAAPVFPVRTGERVRLRLMNPGGATTFRVAVAGHRMEVSHADGRPVEPVTVDSLLLGMGERYDVLVHATNPGAWAIVGSPVDARAPAARAVLRYEGAAASVPPDRQRPSGLQGGKLLALSDLVAVEDDVIGAAAPDRRFDLALAGGMMGAWTINGQAYPNADPLTIHAGERVRVQMTNRSGVYHPMHLHGHFFRVGRALKDTVLVPPRGTVTFDFMADNPGDWFFHCHNLYHMEAGMARVVRYA